MQLSLVQIRDPRVEDTVHGVERSPWLRVWTVGKDADRHIFGTWFRLVLKDLRSGGILPTPITETLPVRTLIRTLAATEMSMMTGTITCQVLHRMVHLETLLMQV
jgi:hypothetical protein